MLIRAKKTLSLPVVSREEILGSLDEIVFDGQSKRVLALSLRQGYFFSNRKLLEIDDVLSFGDEVIEADISPHLFPEPEKSQIKLINNVAITQGGEELGEIKDFEFDDVDYKIQRIFIDPAQNLISGELIISAGQIIEITRSKVVIRDGIVKKKEEEVWIWQNVSRALRER